LLVSIVIPTLNRAHTVGNAVLSILAGNYTNIEIIVVDQSNDDSTRAALAPLMSDNRLRYIQVDRKGASAARNRGIAASRGEIIAFTDDDITANPQWIELIVAEFRADRDLQFVSGALVAPPYDHAQGYIPEFTPYPAITGWELVMNAANANFGARRELFACIGGYDELCGPGGILKSSDDGDIVLRIVRSGMKWKVCPHIRVEHTFGFRPGQAAQALLAEYNYGNGAIFGRAARRGDLIAAAWYAASEVKQGLRNTARMLMRRPQSTLLLTRLKGFWHGFKLPPGEGFVSGATLVGRCQLCP
jgi:glycosyltransferase involved in cell wall biosynthesis